MGPVLLRLGFAGCTYILCMNMYMHVWMHGCGYIGMYGDVCVEGMQVRMYGCVSVDMWVCMYGYVYVYMCGYIHRHVWGCVCRRYTSMYGHVNNSCTWYMGMY